MSCSFPNYTLMDPCWVHLSQREPAVNNASLGVLHRRSGWCWMTWPIDLTLSYSAQREKNWCTSAHCWTLGWRSLFICICGNQANANTQPQLEFTQRSWRKQNGTFKHGHAFFKNRSLGVYFWLYRQYTVNVDTALFSCNLPVRFMHDIIKMLLSILSFSEIRDTDSNTNLIMLLL